jgi:hypothetical protein
MVGAVSCTKQVARTTPLLSAFKISTTSRSGIYFRTTLSILYKTRQRIERTLTGLPVADDQDESNIIYTMSLLSMEIVTYIPTIIPYYHIGMRVSYLYHSSHTKVVGCAVLRSCRVSLFSTVHHMNQQFALDM